MGTHPIFESDFDCLTVMLEAYLSDLHLEAAESDQLQTLELNLIQPLIREALDEDDDLIKVSSIIVPFYSGAQTVENVGLQTWRASLLLAEYIATNLDHFRHRNILELGAGAGVPSLVAGTVANSVTLTDVKSVLPVTRKSVELNEDIINKAIVQKMDWSKEIRTFDQYYDVILAAECAYSRATCQNLFRLVEFLLIEEKPQQVIFAIEERPNFMKSTMKVQCTERDRFLRHLSFIQMKLPVMVERIENENIQPLFDGLDRSRLCIYRVSRFVQRPGE